MVNDSDHLGWEGGARVPDPRTQEWAGTIADPDAVPPGPTSTASIRVAVIDGDETARRSALHAFRSDDRVVVAEAVSTLAELGDLPSDRPIVVVLDPFPSPRKHGMLDDADTWGPRLIETVLGLGIDARVLVLTTVTEQEAVIAALRSGASGYVLKSLPRFDLVHAALTVGGERPAILDPTLLARWFALIRSHADVIRAIEERPGRVFRRAEQHIIDELDAGHSAPEIVAGTGLSPATVNRHLSSLASKYGLLGAPPARRRPEQTLIPPQTGTFEY